MEEFLNEFFKGSPKDAITRKVEEIYPTLAKQIANMTEIQIPSVLTSKTLNSFGQAVSAFVVPRDNPKKRTSEFRESPSKLLVVEGQQEKPLTEPKTGPEPEIEVVAVPVVSDPAEVETVEQGDPDNNPSSESSSSSEEDEVEPPPEPASEPVSETVVAAVDSKQEDKKPQKIDYLKQLDKYANVFCGEFEVPLVTDEPPSVEEYKDVVIEIRQPEKKRQRSEPKRYNDADFEDDEDDAGKDSKKTSKAKDLASQFGLKKGLIILDDVSGPQTEELLDGPPLIKLFDALINKSLQKVKGNLSKVLNHVTKGLYDIDRLASSAPGQMLISYIRSSIRSCISIRAGRGYTRHKNYTMINELGSKILTELNGLIEAFPLYAKLNPPADVAPEQVPRNSLELVLLYHKMYVAFETGFEDNSTYIVKFSNLRDIASKESHSRLFRVKYQQMVQFRALYYLANPLNLIENVCKSFVSKVFEKDPTVETKLRVQKSAELEKVYQWVATEDATKALLSEFVFVITNFEAYFNGTAVKSFFAPYVIYNTNTTVSRTPKLSTKNSQVRLN